MSARSTTNSLSTASPLMLPALRKTLADTIGHLQLTEPWALDMPIQNQFQQHVTGLTSYFDEDKKIIQIWNSTAAGDIFVQHLSRTENLEGSQITTGGFSSRVKEWSEKLMEQPAEPEPMDLLQENLQRLALPRGKNEIKVLVFIHIKYIFSNSFLISLFRYEQQFATKAW